MSPNLTDQDRADLARFLREALEADRFFPRSKKVRRLKEFAGENRPDAYAEFMTLRAHGSGRVGAGEQATRKKG